MSYSALENTPIVVPLTDVARSNGWSFVGTVAAHESCNTGDIKLVGYTLTSGLTYTVSYRVISISGGYVRLYAGTTAGISRAATGYFTETIVAGGSTPFIFFRSDANCQIEAFNISTPRTAAAQTNKNTIAYSLGKGKWETFITCTPDYGFSLFTNSYTLYNGSLYKHQAGYSNRNNFYGTNYKTSVKLAFAQNPLMAKTYIRTSLQSSQLFVTTTDGIKTSLGQTSELVDTDFLQGVLQSGATTINQYSIEGLFKADFLRDKAFDIINGDPLKGNFITIEFVSTDSQVPLTLFSVEVSSVHSFNNVR